MRPFGYTRAATLDEALVLLASPEPGQVRPLAGGTDLLPLMKADLAQPERLVDIKRASELPRRIEDTGEGLMLGALTTLSDMEVNAIVRQRYPALCEAAAVAGTRQIRNMATLGGNLLQRPRCWYFRNPHLECWLKGGETCPAREGENRLHALVEHPHCVAVHPSDLAPVLLALDAEVVLRGPDGTRALPLAQFFAAPDQDRRRETTLDERELLLSVRLPHWPDGTRCTYVKAMDRSAWSFALAGVAVTLRWAESRIQEARVVLSGVASIPWRVRQAEAALIGQADDDAVLVQAAELALHDAKPLRHNAYKLPLVSALVRQALQKLSRDRTAGSGPGRAH